MFSCTKWRCWGRIEEQGNPNIENEPSNRLVKRRSIAKRYQRMGWKLVVLIDFDLWWWRWSCGYVQMWGFLAGESVCIDVVKRYDRIMWE